MTSMQMQLRKVLAVPFHADVLCRHKQGARNGRYGAYQFARHNPLLLSSKRLQGEELAANVPPFQIFDAPQPIDINVRHSERFDHLQICHGASPSEIMGPQIRRDAIRWSDLSPISTFHGFQSVNGATA